MPDPVRRYYERERPIEMRPVEFDRYGGKKYPDGRFHVWIKTTGQLPDDLAIHQCVLAYASDMTLLDAALAPHGRTLFERKFMAASLDHALVAAPAVPRRRLATLRAGYAQSARLARLCPRTYFYARRDAGRLGGARRLGARAARIFYDLGFMGPALDALCVWISFIRGVLVHSLACSWNVSVNAARRPRICSIRSISPPPANPRRRRARFVCAPAQYTRFSRAELTRGFMALAFGSDLRIGAAPRGIRRFNHPIRAAVIGSGSVDRTDAMKRIIAEYADKVPNLKLSMVSDHAPTRYRSAADRREKIQIGAGGRLRQSRSPAPLSRAPIRNA